MNLQFGIIRHINKVAPHCYQQSGHGQHNEDVDMSIIPRTAYIYALLDPTTKEVRYIGWSVNPQNRLNGHITDSKKNRTHCHRWIQSLISRGFRPGVKIVETVTTDTYAERERYWIAHYKNAGARLTNISTGGDGTPGRKMPQEQRQRLSEHARAVGRKPPARTVEMIKNFIAKMTGKKDSDAVRKKKSDGKMGILFSDEHKENLRKHKNDLYNSDRGLKIAEQFSKDYGVLTDAQVLEVWKLAHSGKVSQDKIAKMYGIPQSTVSQIKTGKRYKHVERPIK